MGSAVLFRKLPLRLRVLRTSLGDVRPNRLLNINKMSPKTETQRSVCAHKNGHFMHFSRFNSRFKNLDTSMTQGVMQERTSEEDPLDGGMDEVIQR